MPSPEDLDYFRVRAAEERQRASAATDPEVRRVHLDLARRYAIAAGSHDHVESARDAISRSFSLLSGTSKLASD